MEQAFQQTLSPDCNVRAQGEGYLLQRRENAAPFWSQILELLSNQNVDHSVRFSAATYLKNDLKKSWVPDGNSTKLALIPQRVTDVVFVKENLLEALVHIADLRLQKIVVVCARTLCFNIFPQDWNIIEQLEQALTQTDNLMVAASALLILEKLVKRYRHVEHKEASRRPLLLLEERLLPHVLRLAQRVMEMASQEGPQQADALRLIKLLLKIYYNATFSTLDTDTYIIQTLDSWMAFLSSVIKSRIPVDTALEIPISKCKKRALQTVGRLFKPDAGLEAASREHWTQKYGCHFAQACIECINRPDTSAYNLQLCFRYLAQGFRCANTYKMLVPEFEALALKAFASIQLSDTDEETWREDPANIFGDFNFCEYVCSPRYAAKEFFSFAAKFRAKEFLGPILLLCKNALESSNPRQVDGALQLLAELKERLIRRDPKESVRAKEKDFNGISVVDLLQNYALPLLQSPHVFLRFRAAWMYEQFAQTIKGGSMTEACERLLHLINDPELSVKAQACVALREFSYRDDCKALIGQHVVQLIQVLTRIMSQCASDSVTDTIHTLTTAFPKEILPVAVELCTLLTACMHKWMEYENDDLVHASVKGTLITVSVLVSAGAEDVDSLLAVVSDFLSAMIMRRAEDYYDEVMDMLAIFATQFTSIPEKLWDFFPKLMHCICGDDIATWLQNPALVSGDGFCLNNVTIIIPVFVNIILKDSSFWTRSLQGYTYIVIMRAIVERIVAHELDGHGLHILGAMIRTCPDVHLKELFSWATDFLWAMVNDRRRMDDALVVMCVIITVQPAFVVEKVKMVHFIQALQMSEHLFRGPSMRITRVYAFARLLRQFNDEVGNSQSFMWGVLHNDLEALLELQTSKVGNQMCGDDDASSTFFDDASQDLDEDENAIHPNLLDNPHIFEQFAEDELETELDHMLPITKPTDAFRAAVALMQEQQEACGQESWNMVKQRLEQAVM